MADLGALLPSPLVGTAATAGPDGHIYLFGGSGPAGFNAQIYAFDPTTSAVTAVGVLPQALHDAGAAWDGGEALVCGGGQAEGSSSVFAFTPGGASAATVAGRLPIPLSDLSGVTAQGRPYCMGGWTGQTYSDAVFDLSAVGGSGGTPQVVAHLPHAVRYAAAAALPGGVLVAGGRTASGAPSDAIQWVPLGSSSGASAPAQVGRLPQPEAYAMAAALGDTVVLAGGCDASDTPAGAVLAVNAAGHASAVGTLATPVCYGSAAATDGAVYLFGGRTGRDDTTATAHIWKLTPVYTAG